MASQRREVPIFSILWFAAITAHLLYFRHRSSVNRIPACIGRAPCDEPLSDAPIVVQPSSRASPQVDSNKQKQQEPVHIVYSSDDEGILAVEASIRSCMKHASEPVIFHFVGDTPLSNTSFSHVHYYNLTEVSETYKLEEFTNPKKRGAGWETLNSNIANFVRFAIPDLLPNASKAMWVDHDTIFECDVIPLVRSTLTTTPHVIAAVPVPGAPHGVRQPFKRKFAKKVKYTFNAGVYVVDLDRWRSQEMTSKIRKLTLKNRKQRIYNYGSQPPLVLTIGDKFEHLSPAWNVKVNKLNLGLLNEKACLLHWSGKRKPWNTFGDPDIHNDLWTPYASLINATNVTVQNNGK